MNEKLYATANLIYGVFLIVSVVAILRALI